MDPQARLFQIITLQKDFNFSCQLKVNSSHPILQGHFPGRPVIPGVCLIEAIQEIIQEITGKQLLLSEASQIKFLLPVLPGENPAINVNGTIEIPEENQYHVSAFILKNEKIFVKMKGIFRPL